MKVGAQSYKEETQMGRESSQLDNVLNERITAMKSPNLLLIHKLHFLFQIGIEETLGAKRVLADPFHLIRLKGCALSALNSLVDARRESDAVRFLFIG